MSPPPKVFSPVQTFIGDEQLGDESLKSELSDAADISKSEADDSTERKVKDSRRGSVYLDDDRGRVHHQSIGGFRPRSSYDPSNGEAARIQEHDYAEEQDTHDYGPLRRQSTTLTVKSERQARPHKPFRLPPADGVGPWLTEENRATALLSLFFDVVTVAVLSSFSGTHEIQSASAIPVFFSYYIVIIWIWVSQVQYDVRYEAEDIFHRLAKCLQIMVFVYMGAASGGWSPGLILPPQYAPGLKESDQVNHSRAAESFLTVTIAYSIYRLMLKLEYWMVLISGRRAKCAAKTKGAVVTLVTLTTSSALSIIAAAVPATSQPVASMKVALFYLAMLVEMASLAYQILSGAIGPVKVEFLLDRYAALSLIILGEGFVNLTKAFNKAITGLSVSDAASYAQVFLVIVVMYNIWSFLFTDFPKSGSFNVRRMTAWEFIHIPLHFGILLLMAAMVNVITFDTFAVGLEKAFEQYNRVIEDLQDPNMSLSPSELNAISVYLNRLDLVPSFLQEYAILNKTFANDSHSTEGLMEANQYFVQVLYGVASQSGVNLEGESEEVINRLLSDPSLDSNTTVDITVGSEGSQLKRSPTRRSTGGTPADSHKPIVQILADRGNANESSLAQDTGFMDLLIATFNDSMKGIAWLYPAAGGVLILCAIRSLLRFELMTKEKWWIYGLEIVAGLALGLLGLLDLGSQKIAFTSKGDQVNIVGGNSMMDVVDANWSIAIIVLVYTAVNVAAHVFTYFFNKRRIRAKLARSALHAHSDVDSTNLTSPLR